MIMFIFLIATFSKLNAAQQLQILKPTKGQDNCVTARLTQGYKEQAVACIDVGKVVTVNKIDGNWAQVEYEGYMLWIFMGREGEEKFVSPYTPPANSKKVTHFKINQAIEGGCLNIRTKPSTSGSQVLECASEGSILISEGEKQGSWYPVLRNGKTYWFNPGNNFQYASPISESSASTVTELFENIDTDNLSANPKESEQLPPYQITNAVNGKKVYLRSDNNFQNSPVDALEIGDIIRNPIKKEGNWLLFNHNGQDRWIFLGREGDTNFAQPYTGKNILQTPVKTVSTPSTAKTPNQEKRYFRISENIKDSCLNLRTGPSLDDVVAGCIDAGTVLASTNSDGSWVQIHTEDGKELWFNQGQDGKYAQEIPGPPEVTMAQTTTLTSLIGKDYQNCVEPICYKRGWPAKGTKLTVADTVFLPVSNEVSNNLSYQPFYAVEVQVKDPQTGTMKTELAYFSANNTTLGPPVCNECERQAATNEGENSSQNDITSIASAIAGEECHERNSYLERGLGENHPYADKVFPNNSNKDKDFHEGFPKECIMKAQDMYAGRSSPGFKVCRKNAQGEYPQNAKEAEELMSTNYPFSPCRSLRYRKSVHNSFVTVMNCLGIDPYDMFPLIAVESHFTTSAVSWSGAAGVGQFITDTISDINKGPFKRNQDQIRAKGGDCKELADHIAPSTNKYKCDTVDSPKNPATAFFYSGIYFKQNHKAMMSKIDEMTPIELENGKKITISNKDKEKIATEMAYYAHNWGTGGAKDALEVFLKSRTLKRFLTENISIKSLTYDHFKGAPNSGEKSGVFTKFLQALNNQRSKNSVDREHEMSNYVYVTYKKKDNGELAHGSLSTLTGTTKNIERKIGGKIKCSK